MKQARSRKRLDLVYVFILILIGLIALLMLYPFLYIISVSLSDYRYVSQVTFFPIGLNFDAYQYIFQLKNVQSGYLNTIIYTAVGLAINMVMTVLCAYPLSKKRLPGRRFFNILVLITMYFSAGLIPSYLLVTNYLHINNTIWALVLPGAIGTWNMIVLRTYFISSIPSEIEESCRIDGASELQMLLQIYLPLSLPILVTIGLFYFVGLWNSWFPASLYLDNAEDWPIQLVLKNVMSTQGASLLSGQSGTIAVGQMGKSNSRTDVNSLNNALTLAVALPIILIYPFCQKFFIKGVMVGSLKG